MGLERGLSGIPKNTILELGDLKLQRYNRLNIELLQSEKRCVIVFKFYISLVEKIVRSNSKGVEAKMDGVEVNIEDLRKDMEDLKGGLAKLLQEMLPNGESIVEETHDENKINVSHDFIEYNFGLKIHHVPNIDMMNFDGKDPITWILQMEQYFELDNV